MFVYLLADMTPKNIVNTFYDYFNKKVISILGLYKQHFQRKNSHFGIFGQNQSTGITRFDAMNCDDTLVLVP